MDHGKTPVLGWQKKLSTWKRNAYSCTSRCECSAQPWPGYGNAAFKYGVRNNKDEPGDMAIQRRELIAGSRPSAYDENRDRAARRKQHGFFGCATHFHDGSLLERRLFGRGLSHCDHARVFLSCYSCNAAEG
jgi:hypothetical protein